MNVTSKLQLNLDRLQLEAQKERENRGKEVIKESKLPVATLVAELKDYHLPEDDKVKYMYHVQPQLATLRGLLEAGAPTTQIADVLQVSHASLMRMKDNIPAVHEIFDIARITQVELAQASLYKLAQQDVIEEQALTRDGDIVTLQRVVQPNFQAVKYVLENNMPDQYGTRQVVEHTTGIEAEKLKELLESGGSELLEMVMQRKNAIEAEVVENEE